LIDPSGQGWRENFAEGVLWITGGDESWLDDGFAVEQMQRRLEGVAVGILVTCAAPGAAAWGAGSWGVYRTFGGGSGDSRVDDFMDGAAAGVTVATLPRPWTSTPKGGTLKPPITNQ
jgi:hypothetical protein